MFVFASPPPVWATLMGKGIVRAEEARLLRRLEALIRVYRIMDASVDKSGQLILR